MYRFLKKCQPELIAIVTQVRESQNKGKLITSTTRICFVDSSLFYPVKLDTLSISLNHPFSRHYLLSNQGDGS